MTARLLYKLKRVLPIALLMVYIAQFAAYTLALGGLDPFVRSMDSMPTLTVAQMITDGQGLAIYDLDAQHQAQERVLYPYKSLGPDELLPFNHLPFEAFFMAALMAQPLSWSYVSVTAAWLMLLTLALATALLLMQRALPLQQPWLLLFILCAISYQPVFRAFVLGQNSPLVLLGLCTTFAAMRRRGIQWDLLAGLGLVLVAFKLQMLPLVLVLVLMEGRWKAVLWSGAEMAILTIAAMPIIGSAWPLHYANWLLSVSQWSGIAAINPAVMHNWRGFATNTIGAVIASSATPTTILFTAFSLLLFFYGWWQARKQQGQTEAQPIAMDLLWALGVVTAILISPHLNPHDLMLLIFPGWVILYSVQTRVLSQKLNATWNPLLQILYLIMPISFFVRAAPSLWVVLNVSLLAFSTWLLVRSIQITRPETQ